MRIPWNTLKITGLIVCITGLYAFSDQRAEQRSISGIQVEFVGEDQLYLTEGMVNKLLIQNYGSLRNVSQDAVVLTTMESVLRTCDMVKNAEVFLSVDGTLHAKIVQRHPIGRVSGTTSYYLDDQGLKMPLSPNHSARVPIITGKITGKSLEDVYEILKYINSNTFLSKNVIGIHIEDEADYRLQFRMEDFLVRLGDSTDLDRKFKNFKAFYMKATQDQTLAQYREVNLAFSNQVVCTKI